ncbi:MAG TPA: polysaccharide biosynthesis protein, partial [Bacteroidia bacterium]|nr:polysaccharide biosynthesis protein [Bacteroidia bacterium]
QHSSESHAPTDHERIFRFVPDGMASEASARAIDHLEPILTSASPNMIKQQLKSILPEYTPHLE